MIRYRYLINSGVGVVQINKGYMNTALCLSYILIVLDLIINYYY